MKAELDGIIYWLDGTQSDTRIADIADSPTHRYGLPSIKRGAELEQIPIRRPGRPFQFAKVTYDLTAGTGLPALFELQATLRDNDALKLKNASAHMSAEKAKELREETALQYVVDGLLTETEFTYDEELETGYLNAKGLAYLTWETKADKRQHEIWSVANTFKIQKRRSKEELRALPVQLSYPRYFKYHITYNLPERYREAKVHGQSDVSEELGGFQLDRSVRKDGNQIISEEAYYTSRWELPASEFQLERQKLALLKRHSVEIILPEGAPDPWQEVENYKASEGIENHRTAFNQHVEIAKADDGDPVANRAYFFQQIGEYESAIADLRAALAIESDPATYKWLGDLQLGQYPTAAKANFNKAIEIKPAYFEALLELIRFHICLEEYHEANLVLETAKKNGLSETSAKSLEIEILQAEGKFEKALQIMNALVEEEPDNVSYLLDRCMLRAMQNIDLELALEDCTNMIELAKRNSYHHFIRGLVHYRQGNYQYAINDLDKAIKANDDFGYIYILRAAAHKKLENITKSENDLKAAKFQFKHAGWYWGHFID